MSKIEQAIKFAVDAHAGMKRKGKERPYILHPMEVMCIVADMSEDEDVIAAAVLHDAVEDTEVTAADIEREFGARVAALVMAESEDKMRSLPAEESWKLRKQATVEHLKTLGRDEKLICLGDKLANIREMSRDHALLGDKLWERFNQKDKREHAWYYKSILGVLEEEFGPAAPIREYRELLRNVFGEVPELDKGESDHPRIE